MTSGGQAELGRALGGYVNIVTKSGTNATHGSLYGYFRDDNFNSPNALSGTTLPMSQKQYGGSIGGPINRDKTFFFTNIEQRRLDQEDLSQKGRVAEDRGKQRPAALVARHRRRERRKSAISLVAAICDARRPGLDALGRGRLIGRLRQPRHIWYERQE